VARADRLILPGQLVTEAPRAALRNDPDDPRELSKVRQTD
jgi:hypothetical protein